MLEKLSANFREVRTDERGNKTKVEDKYYLSSTFVSCLAVGLSIF
jgi:hypothetical protein